MLCEGPCRVIKTMLEFERHTCAWGDIGVFYIVLFISVAGPQLPTRMTHILAVLSFAHETLEGY